jgi:hypothetical protein
MKHQLRIGAVVAVSTFDTILRGITERRNVHFL